MDKKDEIEALVKSIDQIINEYGWCLMYTEPTIHTHGLELKEQLNLETNLLMLTRRTIHGIFKDVISKFNTNELEEDKLYYNIIKDYPVKFKKIFSEQENQIMLRIIFPDKNGLFPEDEKCSKNFKNQYEKYDENGDVKYESKNQM